MITKKQLIDDVDSIPDDCELVEFPIPMVPVESVLNMINSTLLPDIANGALVEVMIKAMADKLELNKNEAVLQIMNAARRASALQLTIRLKELSARNDEAARN